MEGLIQYLLKKAKRSTHMDSDDFVAFDIAGGHADDTYFAGQEDGKTLLAQAILDKFFPEVEYDVEED